MTKRWASATQDSVGSSPTLTIKIFGLWCNGSTSDSDSLSSCSNRDEPINIEMCSSWSRRRDFESCTVNDTSVVRLHPSQLNIWLGAGTGETTLP